MSIERTHGLLASDDVNGVAVLGEGGDKLGTVDHLLIDPAKGRIVYAVVSFGRSLGLGEHTRLIPWASVRLQPGDRVFVTGITRQQIVEAPACPDDRHLDRRREERTIDRSQMPPYWL